MRKLALAADLSLPLDFLLRSAVIYGAPESGKTTTASVIAEEAWANRIRFCALDPKGDWYGVKSSRDGKSAAIPAVVFGGDHADLPLDESAGAFVAGIVAGLEQPVVLDMEHLSKGKQIRFVAAFLEALYEKNRDPMLLILDEAQRWAPQKPISPEHTICLGAAEDIAKLGRKHGIGRLFVTQRGAGFNKEVAELMDVLIAHRTPGVLDQERVRDWLQANVGRKMMAEPLLHGEPIMEGIAHLRRGMCVIASAHPDMEMFAVVQVRDRRTFDSSKTPAIGQKHAEPKVLAKPDLEKIRSQMKATIEKAIADDPKTLKRDLATAARTIAGLSRKVAELSAAPPREVEKVVEVVPADVHGLLTFFLKLAREIASSAESAAVLAERTEAALKMKRKEVISHAGTDSIPVHKTAGARRPAAAPAPTVPPFNGQYESGTRVGVGFREAQNGQAEIGEGERKVLAVLAQFPDGRTHRELAFLTGYSAKASTLSVYLAKLRAKGLVEPGKPIRPTQAGLTLVPANLSMTLQGRELLDHWLAHPRMGDGERKVLTALMEAWPDALTHEELCERTGYSPTASTISVYLSHLRKLGLVESGARRIPDAFMEAVRT